MYYATEECNLKVYYVPRRTMRVIARRATMLAGDRSRGAMSPASIVASLVISRIVCVGTYSILCDFGAYTSVVVACSNVQDFVSRVLTLYEEKEE